MNENLKIGIAAIIGIAIGFGLSKMIGKNQDEDKEASNEQGISSSATDNSKEAKSKESDSQEFPLKLGSKGRKVKRLQIHLMRQLGWVRKPDGVFDLNTQKRTIKLLGVEEITKDLYHHLELDKMLHDQRKKRA